MALSQAAIIGISVGAVVFVVGLLVLILWLTGVIGKKSSKAVVPTISISVIPPVTVVVPSVPCPTDGKFSASTSLTGTTAQFGIPVSTDKSGEYLCTVENEDATTEGKTVIYKDNSGTYTAFDESNFTLPANTRVGFSIINDAATYVCTAIQNKNYGTTENELFRITRSGSGSFFNSPQDISAAADGYKLVTRSYFPRQTDESKEAIGDEMYLGFSDTNALAILKHYRLAGDGSWEVAQTLESPKDQVGVFGSALYQVENMLLVSQYEHAAGFLYVRPDKNSPWVLQQNLIVPSSSADQWGWECGMTSNGLIAYFTSPLTTVDGTAKVGETYIYKKNSLHQNFEHVFTIRPPVTTEDTFLGIGAAFYGNTLMLSPVDAGLTQRNFYLYTIDTDTGEATLTQTQSWPFALTSASSLISAASGYMFRRDNDLRLVMGFENSAGEKGKVSFYSTSCQ